MSEFTVVEAAVRVKRSRPTIERWVREGMPFRWGLNERGHRIRLISEEHLLAAYREALRTRHAVRVTRREH